MIVTSNWREFRLGDWFEVRKGKRLTSEDQEPGTTPYIGAIDSNNGVANHISQNPIHDGKTITLSYNGSVGEAFYQPEAYWSTDDVNALYLKDCAHHEMNEKIGLFVATVLRQEKYRFSYGRKWTLPNMRNAVVKLPADANGNPDWAWMEQYMDSLSVKPITTAVKSLKMPLDIGSWREFHVEDILTILNGKGITKDEITENPGDIEAIQSGEANLGILGRIDREYCKQMGYTMTDEMCLTVARSGSSGYVAYHPRGCVVGDSAKILLLKDPIAKTASIYLFIRTILEANRYKYCYGRKVTTEGYKYEMIKLPVDAESNPDWAWMEQYMKSLPYSEKINSSE